MCRKYVKEGADDRGPDLSTASGQLDVGNVPAALGDRNPGASLACELDGLVDLYGRGARRSAGVFHKKLNGRIGPRTPLDHSTFTGLAFAKRYGDLRVGSKSQIERGGKRQRTSGFAGELIEYNGLRGK